MSTQKKILVTGANGQLGMELQQLVSSWPQFNFIFTTRQELPLDNPEIIHRFISRQQPHYLINCAAYTAVDKAESEPGLAYQLNADAPAFIAAACQVYKCQLIHISTDYVFKGSEQGPYREDDSPDPVNLYGASKLEGERNILRIHPGSVIIRTAWVYSEFGKNFVKTMLGLMANRDEINVVNDQSGTPTYAADLSAAIMTIISTIEETSQDLQLAEFAGVYHFSNAGHITWYDFAVAIKEFSGSACRVNPISSSQFPTAARRPFYSVLDKTKIQKVFGILLNDWKTSLAVCLEKLKTNSV